MSSAQNDEKVRLDLFKLHDENDVGQGRIKAVNNPELRLELKQMVSDIRNTHKVVDICKFVGLPYYEFWRCLNRRHIPLITIYKLAEFWSAACNKGVERKLVELEGKVSLLSHGAGNTYKTVKAPKTVTKNLCKICGAVVADGHLRHSKYKNGMYDHSIVVRDQFEDNLALLAAWLREEFDIITTPRFLKDQNLWYIDFSNKIIFRYLNFIFKIPHGKKSDIVQMPEIISMCSPDYQRAFMTGVFMFDGGIDHRTGYFDLSTKSRQLQKDTENVLKIFGIEPDYIGKDIDKYSGVFELRIRKASKLMKLFELFVEPDTTKWRQLAAHVHGFDDFKTLSDAIAQLSTIYPRVRDGITFWDVLDVFKKHGALKAADLPRLLNRKKTLVYEFLNRLEKWNLLKSSREGLYKVWRINSDLLDESQVESK